ncbi:hypothetical protein STEG23_009288, partial [Scotinomys teguina]
MMEDMEKLGGNKEKKQEGEYEEEPMKKIKRKVVEAEEEEEIQESKNYGINDKGITPIEV